MSMSPHTVHLALAHQEELRPTAERVRLVAVWTGIVVFCLAFWAAVTMAFVS